MAYNRTSITHYWPINSLHIKLYNLELCVYGWLQVLYVYAYVYQYESFYYHHHIIYMAME